MQELPGRGRGGEEPGVIRRSQQHGGRTRKNEEKLWGVERSIE